MSADGRPVEVGNMRLDDNPDFMCNLQISNWIFNIVKRSQSSIDSESEGQAYAFHVLSTIHRLTTAFQESDDLIARAMVVRAMIECLADLFAVYNAVDRETSARLYMSELYQSYAKLHAELIKIKKAGGFSRTKMRERIFDNRPAKWSQVGLLDRVKAIDKYGEALNMYDVLSHYIHMSGSGSTHLIDDLIRPTICPLLNLYICAAIGTLRRFEILTDADIKALRAIIKNSSTNMVIA